MVSKQIYVLKVYVSFLRALLYDSKLVYRDCKARGLAQVFLVTQNMVLKCSVDLGVFILSNMYSPANEHPLPNLIGHKLYMFTYSHMSVTPFKGKTSWHQPFANHRADAECFCFLLQRVLPNGQLYWIGRWEEKDVVSF